LDKKPATVLIVVNSTDADKIAPRIDDHSDFSVCANTDAVAHLTEQVQSLTPDVLVLDIELPGLKWANAVYEIKDGKHRPAVVVLAKRRRKADVLSAFREGADAYLIRKNLRKEIIFALEAVRSGCIYFRQSDAQVVREHMLYLELGSAGNVAGLKDGIAKLTVREKEVFPLLADGKSIKETAKILGISPKTVETHKYNIMKKLDVDRMADLTKLALIKDLIPI
jgi:DNA-binding NarL/FixJ family response regulator